jgi:hypothetical protein
LSTSLTNARPTPLVVASSPVVLNRKSKRTIVCSPVIGVEQA